MYATSCKIKVNGMMGMGKFGRKTLDVILPAKSIRDMLAAWSACLLCCLLCCLLSRVLCGRVRWSCAVVFALLFQVSRWVFGYLVPEAVRVVHVLICTCVVQRGVAALHYLKATLTPFEDRNPRV